MVRLQGFVVPRISGSSRRVIYFTGFRFLHFTGFPFIFSFFGFSDFAFRFPDFGYLYFFVFSLHILFVLGCVGYWPGRNLGVPYPWTASAMSAS